MEGSVRMAKPDIWTGREGVTSVHPKPQTWVGIVLCLRSHRAARDWGSARGARTYLVYVEVRFEKRARSPP
jgi:hypothetical protein